MEQSESKTKLVIIGKNGQISSSLLNLLEFENDFEVTSYSSKDLDLSNLEKLEILLAEKISHADIIINCAAYTNVDKAEDEKDLCNTINNKAVSIIANHCKKNHIKLIHYSTDYVFDGSGDKPFTEDNTENLHPLNHYGKTKLWGEKAIIGSGCEYTIFRISWAYDLRSESKNFVNTIKRLAQENKTLKIVDDQIGSPTSAYFVASNTIRFIKKIRENHLKNNQKFPSEIYHLNNGKYISWYEFALEIVDSLKRSHEILKIQEIKPIKSSEYKTKATRPLNSRLCNKKIKKFLGLDFCELQKRYLAVFAHYDRDQIVDDYVLYYLKELKKVANEIIFISDCNLPKNELEKLSDLCIYTKAERHEEYDFGSYKRGIQYAQGFINNYDSLIIANDSCYGPIKPLAPIFNNMELRKCDFWGMTINQDETINQETYKPHIQSYFVVFNKNVFLSEVFKNFFNNVKKESCKSDIIQKYEVGMTSALTSANFKSDGFISTIFESNPTVSKKYIRNLIPAGFPFLKLELVAIKIRKAKYFELALFLPIEINNKIKKHSKRIKIKVDFHQLIIKIFKEINPIKIPLILTDIKNFIFRSHQIFKKNLK